jgi:hypothetical protein
MGGFYSRVADITEKVESFETKIRSGEQDWKGMAVAIGESIPVIGGFVKAGQNIREMFTHEKAELAAINELAEATTASKERELAMSRELAGLRRQYWAEERSAVRDIGLIGLRGVTATLGGIENSRQAASAAEGPRRERLRGEHPGI